MITIIHLSAAPNPFDDPEITEILQFLDPEIVKMDKKILDPEILKKVDKSFMYKGAQIHQTYYFLHNLPIEVSKHHYLFATL